MKPLIEPTKISFVPSWTRPVFFLIFPILSIFLNAYFYKMKRCEKLTPKAQGCGKISLYGTKRNN